MSLMPPTRTIAGFSLLLLLTSTTLAQDVARRQVHLTGRVVARVNLLLGFPENSLGGQHYDDFVFQVDSKRGSTKQNSLIKVRYEFYRDEPGLADSFFDHSRRYGLRLTREPACDEMLESISYEQNVSENGEALPPTYVLQILKGAPKDLLKTETKLQCFILRRVISRLLGTTTDQN